MTAEQALNPPKINLQPVEHIRVWRQRQGSDYIRKAAAVVKTAFEVTGETRNPVYLVYSALLRHPDCTTGNMKLASVALQSLGRVLRTMNALEKEATTAATRLAAGLRSVASGATTVLPEVAKTLAYFGGGVGALGGGGLWAVNRLATKEDQKLREMEIQRDTYRRLTAEVQDELSRRGMQPTPANTAAAVDYLT